MTEDLLQDLETFSFEDVYGEVVTHHKPTDLEGEIRRLSDPAAAEETIHWGRNYLYKTKIETPQGPLDVVVKQFRNQGLRQRLKRKWGGSKATRSWRVANAFRAAGLSTAEAVMLIESKRPDGPSFFVTRFLPEVVEARYLLRAANAHQESELFPEIDMGSFIRTLGGVLRRMHEAGFFHRDLSIGNVLLATGQPTIEPEHIYLIDLNRARIRSRLSLHQRTKDLCRLAIFRQEQQDLFLDSYWAPGAPGLLATWFFKTYHYGFRYRIEAKNRLRAATRRIADWLRPRRAHAHIPQAPSDASSRDKIVWDYLSDQPHQHAGRFEKLGVRIKDAPSHLRYTAAFLAAVPRIMTRYRALRRELHEKPVPWDGVGICLRPLPEAPELLLSTVDDLGVDKVLLRLHPWDEDHHDEEALAKALVEKGIDLCFALPQNRDLVRDPRRWTAKIEELAERFTPYGRHFQIGQAINRSKWGIWRYGDYLDLASSAAEVLRRYPEVEIMGPAVIDFEFHVTAALLNLRRSDLHFDILSSLLYVDRRGAPEHTQLGFDTVGKILLAKAIAETARNCDGRSWVTEVNWPLWEGPHSPAGRSVSVDPETQADFLARFYLLALASGAVERVYWWQLVARGYGLTTLQSDGDDVALARRPAFDALATLHRLLAGSTFVESIPSPPRTHLYRFELADGEKLIAAWSTADGESATLPQQPREVLTRDGDGQETPLGRQVELSGSVQYFRL